MKQKSLMAVLRGRWGGSSLMNFLSTLLVCAALLAVYIFFPPYFDNWKLKNTFKSLATKASAMENLAEIKLYALRELAGQQYYFEPEQLEVSKEGRQVHFRVSYNVERTVPLTNYGVNIHFDQEGGTD